MPRRVLAVASVRVDPLTFEYNLRSLRMQKLPPGCQLDLHYVLDDPEPEPLAALIEAYNGTWELSPERPTAASYSVGSQTHDWNEAAFEHLARNKQKLLDKARSEHYDYVWIVDTDLILDPLTLWSALALDEPVVTSVFWTPWQHGAQPMPQVWLAQPYVQQGMGMSQEEFWDKLSRRKVVPVAGGGACMLAKAEVLSKARYWPRLDGLPRTSMWQGEDRTFAILCQRGHVTQVADGWPDIAHMYHADMRAPEVLAETFDTICGTRQRRASYGDIVNFTLESLDESQVAGKLFPVRGRLGGLWLAPEIEAALLDTEIGQRKFLEVLFPLTWPVAGLRGKRRIMSLEFVDAKPFSYPPMLAEQLFAGVEA